MDLSFAPNHNHANGNAGRGEPGERFRRWYRKACLEPFRRPAARANVDAGIADATGGLILLLTVSGDVAVFTHGLSVFIDVALIEVHGFVTDGALGTPRTLGWIVGG